MTTAVAVTDPSLANDICAGVNTYTSDDTEPSPENSVVDDDET